MQRLYKVTVTMMVAADSEREAKSEASRADFQGCDIDVMEAVNCPIHWKAATPFGAEDDELTCDDLLGQR